MKAILGIAAVLAVVTKCAALPIKRASSIPITDTVILNFALTLEHLEVAFYQEGLAKFDEAAFEAAGLPPFARGRFEQISVNEQTHERVLTEILGPNATQACTYSFPLSDPKAFAAMSAIFEGVGTAAYTGAANLLSDPTHVTEAASILATEARQAAWVESAVNKENPWSTPFETPLDMNQAFSLAAGFIVSCPSTNPVLPAMAFPVLNVTSPSYAAGDILTLSFNRTAAGAAPSNESTQLFLSLLTGLGKIFLPVYNAGGDNWSTTLPEGLKGTVYALVTNSNMTATDSDTVAGVAALQFPFNSQAPENS
ncbi:ferritin-like domain-containing protein [Phellopilus nigrolimitatus]|nr:ferritin-like domain-containing protein [Phellopilus nigrolimitatus]